MRTFLRSNMSAIAPAGRESTRRGIVDEAAMRPTHKGESVNSSISHEAATVWRNDPIFETMAAIHSARNRLILSGAMACVTTPVYGGAALGAALRWVYHPSPHYCPDSIFSAADAAPLPDAIAALIPPPPTHAPANSRFGMGDFELLRFIMFSTVCSRP